MFVNGVEVFGEFAKGFASIREYSQSVSGALSDSGIGTVSVLA